jgi:uncharacterized membrane protein
MEIVDSIAFAVGVIAIAVILWGVVLGLIELARYEYYRLKRRSDSQAMLSRIRHVIGSYLLLGLEFLIAADIIHSVVEPTLEELAILGGLVAIRTVISFFLGKEVGEGRTYRFIPPAGGKGA